MKLTEIFRLVWLNLSSNKFKVILTSTGIIVGAATIMLVIAIGTGGREEVAEQFKNLNAGAVDITYEYQGTDFGSRGGGAPGGGMPAGGMAGGGGMTGGMPDFGGGGMFGGMPGSGQEASNTERITLSTDDLEDILTFVPGVDEGCLSFTTTSTIDGGELDDSISATVAGVQSNYASLSNLVLALGEFLDDDNDTYKDKVCVLGYDTAREIFGSVYEAYDGTVYIDNRPYQVIGILNQVGTVASGISPDDAIFIADSNSLLIVVDTNRPDFVDYPEVLQTIQRVAVIDHHRRAASYIENYVISLHEPYASSASELVTELLQYILSSSQELRKEEAEALLAGIFLDTKSFTVKTGVRTFEAAAYLKQCGADTVEVRKLFNNNFDSYIKKYQIISNAEQTFPGVSISVFNENTERAVASQAADELININDIKASFVVFKEHDKDVAISARSYGKMNVQVVLEKLGGGGSLTMAGAQFANANVEDVARKLREAIEQYLAADHSEADGQNNNAG